MELSLNDGLPNKLIRYFRVKKTKVRHCEADVCCVPQLLRIYQSFIFMKKFLIAVALIVTCSIGAMAQKFALVDMEYILKNIPAYEMANEQLNQVSLRWQKEVDDLAKEAETMYKNYQSDMVFLTDEQKKTKEEEIVAKEKEVTELRYKYFGPQGELFQKRQSLIKPIQDDVYAAIKKVSEERGYQVIFDRASSQSIVFASPRIDISNEVLTKLGYGK